MSKSIPFPLFLSELYDNNVIQRDDFDVHIYKQLSYFRSKLRDVSVVIGIPFYTELTNIVSILITLRQVFQTLHINVLFMIIGEFSRMDCIEEISEQLNDIQDGEIWEQQSYVSVETMWKHSHVYSGKSWTVRALQIIAANCGQPIPKSTTSNTANNAGTSNSSIEYEGAHLLIIDADIQFNHFELSAQSLVHTLLQPLLLFENIHINGQSQQQATTTHDNETAITSTTEAYIVSSPLPSCFNDHDLAAMPPSLFATSVTTPHNQAVDPSHAHNGVSINYPPSSMVVLNAPRSFHSDDGLIHVGTYLLTYMMLGIELYQSNGGEFSIHRNLNKRLLHDHTIVYANCYEVENAFAYRSIINHIHVNKEHTKRTQESHHPHKEQQQQQQPQSTSDAVNNINVNVVQQTSERLCECLMKGTTFALILFFHMYSRYAWSYWDVSDVLDLRLLLLLVLYIYYLF